MEISELLTKMQLDCIKATQVFKDMEKMLGYPSPSFEDERMDELVGDILFIFEDLLFHKLYRRPKRGNEGLTEDDYEMLFKNYGISKKEISKLRERLADITEITYFEMKAINGHFVIHPIEFTGEGCTGINAFIMPSEGLATAAKRN